MPSKTNRRRTAAYAPRASRWLAGALAAALLLGSGTAVALRSPDLAPRLRAHGYTLKWTAVGRSRVFKLLIEAGGKPKLATVRKLQVTPKPASGRTIRYRVRLAKPGSRWSNRVAIKYPAKGRPAAADSSPIGSTPAGVTTAAPSGSSTAKPVSRPAPPALFVGLNAGGWGASAFADIAGAARFVRLESKFASDAEVGGAAAAGVSIEPWLFGTGSTIGAIDPATYAAEIVALFKRYGKGGTFWSGREDLGSESVEVLNEPGNPTFWSDPTNYSAYVRLLKTVHEALLANFSEENRPKLLASWDGGEGPNSDFGQEWAALGGLSYVDGVTVHSYGGSSGQNGGALGARAGVEAAHTLSGKPVYITEVGWPTDVGASATGDSQQWSEAAQAQNIKSFVEWAKLRSYIKMVIVFNFVDYGPDNWYGIEREDRSHKPSFDTLAEVSS
ncbi:MAG TPA: hypothetical protein VH081_01645 [Solirubrobacteraceae bacterium]|jgi:hypothetical protein|nr:hypothetical protein [Solirubrobacteraceae bacterium]